MAIRFGFGSAIHSPMGRNALGSTRYGHVGIGIHPISMGSRGGLGRGGFGGAGGMRGGMRGGMMGGGMRGR